MGLVIVENWGEQHRSSPLVRNVLTMEWPLRHQNLYRIFTPTEDDLSVLRGYVLVEVDEDGVVEDTMRIAVHGESAVRISFRSEVLKRTKGALRLMPDTGKANESTRD
jgi:hypothetical protein